MALSQRRFGVEIECGHPEGVDGVRNHLTKNKLKPLSVGHDGSGVEVRSPVLKGVPGLKWLEEAYQCLREFGAYVTNSDGAHVHHEAKELVEKTVRVKTLDDYTRRVYKNLGYSDRQINDLFHVDRKETIVQPAFYPSLRLIKSFTNNEKILDSFVASRRRGPEARHCRKLWTPAQVKEYEKNQTYPGMGRGALNLSSVLSSKRTVEIRMHEGTLDFEEIEAWIRLGQSLIEYAIKKDDALPKCKDAREFLGKLELDEKYVERLVAKAKLNGKPGENSRWYKNKDAGIAAHRELVLNTA